VPRFYLTTAIDYANGDPHLGHAYEKLGADAIARWRRLRGDDVWFLIGMDEHGQKVAQSAAAEGVSPAAFTTRIAARFEDTWARLGISHDQFIRTTTPAHQQGVQDLIEQIFERNPDDFYEREYEGRYCVGCESFKPEAEVVDGRCALHPTRTLETVRELNWFFRLSRYREFLRQHIEDHPDFLAPASRRNEILGLLDQGLDDISASRSRLGWGVPFPRLTSQGERQTTYVWFDALPNYWTATRVPGSGATWPAQLHVIGKDITRFHAVIWPAMLQAAGLPLPERVWAHGFVLLGGERFSKSAGVRLDLDEAIDRFGPDAFRYFLLREIAWDGDGSFTWERFEERYTSDLADGLGNLTSRTLAMLSKYRDGVVPASTQGTALDEDGSRALDRYARAMDSLELKQAGEAAWSLVTQANQFIVQTAPWALAKAGRDEELDQSLASLARCLYRLTVMATPFLPGKAELLWQALGQSGTAARSRWDAAQHPPIAGSRTEKPPSLFPRPGVEPES
jgi:methionyl-tRNA synthetase